MVPGRLEERVVRIVTDPAVLEPEFVPDVLPRRRTHIERLDRVLDPARPGGRAESTILAGPTGSGKTCTARYAIRQLATRRDVTVHHVNCAQTDGQFDVLRQLLVGADIPTYDLHRGSTAHATLMDRLATRLDQPYVAVVDGVGRLQDSTLLYGLYRIPALTLVVIANRIDELLASLDPRLRSRLRAGVRLDFEQYEETALIDILNRRVEAGLAAGVIDDAQVRQLARAAGGDAGRAVRTLRTAARLAEQTDTDAIDAAVVDRARDRTAIPDRHRDVADLSSDRRLLYEIVRESDGIAPSDVYERYRDRLADPKTERTVRTYLADLVEDDLLRVEGATRRRQYFIVTDPSP